MNSKSLKWIVILFSVFSSLMLSCTSKPHAEYKREASFFAPMINDSGSYALASEKVADLKLLSTGDAYPIRLALFDNGLFYYQVDKLGEGEGRWEYKDGALSLVAPRRIFDMELVITAAGLEGNDILVEFSDRFGFKSLATQFRDPTGNTSSGASSQNQKPPALKPFSSSDKGI